MRERVCKGAETGKEGEELGAKAKPQQPRLKTKGLLLPRPLELAPQLPSAGEHFPNDSAVHVFPGG